MALPFFSHATHHFLKIVDGEMISLTDIWQGEGAVEAKKPDNWLHIADTAEFLATCIKSAPGGLLAGRPESRQGSSPAISRWAEIIIKECEKHGLIKRTKGRSGGTYAHWQIAMEYAGYLSPELRIHVNTVFRERLQEIADLELGLSRAKMRAIKTWEDRKSSLLPEERTPEPECWWAAWALR